MATLTAKLTLTSSTVNSDTLNVSVIDTLTIQNPSVSLARASVLHTDPTELLSVADHTAIAEEVYFYVKNMDDTNFVAVKTAAGADFARLRAGEFMFLPLREALGLEVQAHTATCIVEYGYWTFSG